MLKGSSSKWLNDTGEAGNNFAWQEGYGAFSVSASQTAAVVEYIRNQERHHQKRDYEADFLDLLNRYGVSYDTSLGRSSLRDLFFSPRLPSAEALG